MNVVTKITTLTSREFNQDLGRAKRAAEHGPVVVTDRGKPAHVLLSYEEYQRLHRGPQNDRFNGKSLVDLLAMPAGTEDFEFELPERRVYERPIDLD